MNAFLANNKLLIGVAGAVVGLGIVLTLVFSGGNEEVATTEKVVQTSPKPASSTPAKPYKPTAKPSKPSNTTNNTPKAVVEQKEIRPAFDIIRIEKTGDAVMAGTAPPQWGVRVIADGQTIGQTISDESGSWVILKNRAFRSGNHKLIVEAASPDGAKFIKGDGFVTVALAGIESNALVVTTDPRAGSRVLQLPGGISSASGAMVFQTVDYDASGRLILTGSAPSDSTVRAYLNNALIGDALVRGNGSWGLYSGVDIAPGIYELRIDQVDADGTVVSRVVVPFQRPTDEQLAGVDKGHVIIQPGNNLWNISRVIYGSGVRYTTIYEANKSKILDPNLIFPGQVFSTPGISPPEYIPPSARAAGDLK